MNNALGFPFGFFTNDNTPADAKYFKNFNNTGTKVPYVDVAEANTLLVSGLRHIGLTINIAGVEYWYNNGILDTDLVVKVQEDSNVLTQQSKSSNLNSFRIRNPFVSGSFITPIAPETLKYNQVLITSQFTFALDTTHSTVLVYNMLVNNTNGDLNQFQLFTTLTIPNGAFCQKTLKDNNFISSDGIIYSVSELGFIVINNFGATISIIKYSDDNFKYACLKPSTNQIFLLDSSFSIEKTISVSNNIVDIGLNSSYIYYLNNINRTYSMYELFTNTLIYTSPDLVDIPLKIISLYYSTYLQTSNGLLYIEDSYYSYVNNLTTITYSEISNSNSEYALLIGIDFINKKLYLFDGSQNLETPKYLINLNGTVNQAIITKTPSGSELNIFINNNNKYVVYNIYSNFYYKIITGLATLSTIPTNTIFENLEGFNYVITDSLISNSQRRYIYIPRNTSNSIPFNNYLALEIQAGNFAINQLGFPTLLRNYNGNSITKIKRNRTILEWQTSQLITYEELIGTLKTNFPEITDFWQLPSGTTAQRPTIPVNGMYRYNTTTAKFEFYENGAWINIGSGGGGGTVTSVTGTTNRITSTGGATPVIDIDSAYVGQTSLTTLGTITTGVWNGTSIVDARIASAAVWNALVSNANHTGDATGATALTLATVNSNVGTFNNFTVNAKGLITAASNVSYQLPITLTTVGNTPNANGLSFVSNVLNLQSFDATNGGVITTGNQIWSGDKKAGQNGSNATSTATQKNSFKLQLEGSNWTGSVESKSVFDIYNKSSITVNIDPRLTFAYNTTDVFQIDKTGKNFYLQNFSSNNGWNLWKDNNNKLLIFDTSGNIGIGSNSLQANVSSSNIAIGNFSLQNLTSSSNNNIAIGSNCVSDITSSTNSLYIGCNQFMINGLDRSVIFGNSLSTSTYNNYYFGGLKTIDSNDLTTDINIFGLSAKNGSGVNDKSGGDINIHGGAGNGQNFGGSIIFKSTAPNITSSNNLNPYSTTMSISNQGIFMFGVDSLNTGIDVLFIKEKRISNISAAAGWGGVFIQNGTLKYVNSNGFIITL